MPKLPDAEVSAASTSIHYTATVLPEFIVRPLPNCSNLIERNTQRNCNGGACFKYGLTGHFAWQCPAIQAVPRAGNQAKPQGQQNYMYDKVNHMQVMKFNKPKMWYWVCFLQAHTLQLFYLILEHLIHSYHQSLL
jgi:hypothetical protein